MPITVAQKDEIQQVIDTLLKSTAPRGKRQLAGMFLDLVDREAWAEYYEVRPHVAILLTTIVLIWSGLGTLCVRSFPNPGV